MKILFNIDLFVIFILNIAILPNVSFSQNEKRSYSELYKIAEDFYSEGKNYESAVYYEKAADKLKESDTSNPRQISDALGNAASCYYDLGLFEKTIEYCEKGLVFSRIAKDSTETSTHFSNMGQAYVYLGKHDEAIKSFQKSLEIDKAMKYEEGIANNLNSLGKVYEVWQRFSDAIYFYEQSLAIARNLKNKKMIAVRLSSLGTVYKSIGQYDKALDYQEKALAIEMELNNFPKMAVRLDCIGEIYQLKKDYSKSEKYFLRALNIVDSTDKSESRINTSRAIILNHLAKNYYLRKKIIKAVDTYNECLKVSKEIGLSSILIKSYKELSDLYKDDGNYKKSYEYYNLYVAYKDSAFNEESRKQVNEFREKYETERKEKQILALTKENEVNEITLRKSEQQKIFIAGIVVLLFILSLVIYGRYRFKRKANIRLEEQNRELEILNATRNRFFAIISHDLRSPITSFEKITCTLHNNLENIDKNTIQEFIRDMNIEAVNLNIFLKRLLQWAMTQTGNLKPGFSAFNLSKLVMETLSNLDLALSEKNIEIMDNEDLSLTAFADKEMIETVIRNILMNAIKFSDNNSQIIIKSQNQADKIKLSVINSGPGLTEEQSAMLFRIDVPVNKIGNHPAKGSGLGLILCSELMQLNNGSIFVENISAKKTTFSIILPIHSIA
jgi:signal transduction histidine kinase